MRHETATNTLSASTTTPSRFSGTWWKRMWNDLAGRTEADRPVVDILTTDNAILSQGLASVQRLQGNPLAHIYEAHNAMKSAQDSNLKIWGANSNLISTLTVPTVSVPAVANLGQAFSVNNEDNATEGDKKTSQNNSTPNYSQNMPAYGLMNTNNNPFNTNYSQSNWGSPGKALC